jgi:nucleotide-binding universal stress UspA family protein
MINRILVPLDGSALAENALPYALRLAVQLNAHLLLVRVAELPPLINNTAGHQAEFIKNAEFYLNGIQRTLTNRALTHHLELEEVQTLAVAGEPVLEIIQIASSRQIDLIVMSTHGYSGISPLTLGRVAGKVLAQTKLPVVLIRPTKLGSPDLLIDTLAEADPPDEEEAQERILVTLDGTLEAETALDVATDLAYELKAPLYLLQVVPLFSSLVRTDSLIPEEGADYFIDSQTELERAEAYDYLEKRLAGIRQEGINCYGGVRVGNPMEEIVDYAHKTWASLIVMATALRSKGVTSGLGSVAQEVMNLSHLPVMMVSRSLTISPVFESSGAKQIRETIKI